MLFKNRERLAGPKDLSPCTKTVSDFKHKGVQDSMDLIRRTVEGITEITDVIKKRPIRGGNAT